MFLLFLLTLKLDTRLDASPRTHESPSVSLFRHVTVIETSRTGHHQHDTFRNQLQQLMDLEWFTDSFVWNLPVRSTLDLQLAADRQPRRRRGPPSLPPLARKRPPWTAVTWCGPQPGARTEEGARVGRPAGAWPSSRPRLLTTKPSEPRLPIPWLAGIGMPSGSLLKQRPEGITLWLAWVSHVHPGTIILQKQCCG